MSTWSCFCVLAQSIPCPLFTDFHFHSLSEFVLCGLFLPEWILLEYCYASSGFSLLQCGLGSRIVYPVRNSYLILKSVRQGNAS